MYVLYLGFSLFYFIFTGLYPFYSAYVVCPMPCAILANLNRKKVFPYLSMFFALRRVQPRQIRNMEEKLHFWGLTKNLAMSYKTPVLLFSFFLYVVLLETFCRKKQVVLG